MGRQYDVVALAEQLAEEIAACMECDTCADSLVRARSQPEHQRGEKYREPRGLANGRKMTEREDHARDDERRPHLRAEDPNATG